MSLICPVEADYFPGKIENWEFGLQTGYYEYEETNFLEDGSMSGLNLHFDYGTFLGYVAEFDGEYSVGTLDYDGQTISDPPQNFTTNSDDSLQNYGIRIGQQNYRDHSVYYPYIGIGYRYWNNTIKDGGAGSGYERQIRYYYFPLGVKMKLIETFFGWKQQIRVEYMQLLEGESESHLSDINSSNPDVEMTQDNGFGLRLEYDLHNKKAEESTWRFRGFLNYWNIDRSETVDTNTDINGDGVGPDSVFKPDNETVYSGLKLITSF